VTPLPPIFPTLSMTSSFPPHYFRPFPLFRRKLFPQQALPPFTSKAQVPLYTISHPPASLPSVFFHLPQIQIFAPLGRVSIYPLFMCGLASSSSPLLLSPSPFNIRGSPRPFVYSSLWVLAVFDHFGGRLPCCADPRTLSLRPRSLGHH